MRFLLSLFGAVLFLVAAKLGYGLLISDNLSGAEFVSLIVAFAVIGLILAFSSEVQEFSVAGNIVKLKEVKKDAEKSIEELKAARTETFRFLLNLAIRHPGGFSDGGTVDGRVKDFWLLHEQIVAFKCEDDLAENICAVTNILIKGQLGSISRNSDKVGQKYSGKIEMPTPSQLTIDALDNESVDMALKRGIAGGDTTKLKEMLVIGLDEYKKLFDLQSRLQVKM